MQLANYLCAIAALAGVVGTAGAQDDCTALLKHGIYDKTIESGASESQSQVQDSICRAYHQYKSDQAGGSAGGNYYAISGNVSYSQAQIQEIGSSMCEHHSDAEERQAYQLVDHEAISTAAVEAWKQCVNNTLIASNTTFQDDGQGTVGLTLSFRAIGGGNGAKVTSVIERNLKCSTGDLKSITSEGDTASSQVATGRPFTGESRTIDCTRAVANTPHLSGTREVYADSARLVIATSLGDITRVLPAIVKPPPPSPIPSGTIVAYYSNARNIPEGWRLCDGTDGTPDLTNRFIRGTTDWKKVGIPDGSDNVAIPTIPFQVGESGHAENNRQEYVMMAGGVGVTNQVVANTNYVNSNTQAESIAFTPSYVGLIFIMKM